MPYFLAPHREKCPSDFKKRRVSVSLTGQAMIGHNLNRLRQIMPPVWQTVNTLEQMPTESRQNATFPTVFVVLSVFISARGSGN